MAFGAYRYHVKDATIMQTQRKSEVTITYNFACTSSSYNRRGNVWPPVKCTRPAANKLRFEWQQGKVQKDHMHGKEPFTHELRLCTRHCFFWQAPRAASNSDIAVSSQTKDRPTGFLLFQCFATACDSKQKKQVAHP